MQFVISFAINVGPQDCVRLVVENYAFSQLATTIDDQMRLNEIQIFFGGSNRERRNAQQLRQVQVFLFHGGRYYSAVLVFQPSSANLGGNGGGTVKNVL
jgi:hypothetical protein